MTADISGGEERWEVRTHKTKMMTDTGCAPMVMPEGWEPFATSVSQTGKTWVWLRRLVSS